MTRASRARVRLNNAKSSNPVDRQLAFEPLEDRRLLSAVTVSNNNDLVNGDTTSIAALLLNQGGDGVSLREAIEAANADAAADVINFASTLTSTIQLTNVGHAGEIVINNDLSINGPGAIGPGASLLTIQAFDPDPTTVGNGARIFNVDDGNFTADKSIAISGLTLTGGDSTASGNFSGGAIHSFENLTLTGCTISDNRVAGAVAQGGGIWQYGGNLTINACTISGNTASRGGGIYAKSVANLLIQDSTISGNSTGSSIGVGGGGIVTNGGNATIINSTISGNKTNSHGGGIYHYSGSLTVRHSTITGNKRGPHSNDRGGGVYVRNVGATANLENTIVAGNLAPFISPITPDDVFGPLTARYSLIGDDTGATITDNGGNQIGTGGAPIDPLLGLLDNNLGPTFTHALLAGSPAIDAGDPSFSPPPTSDQRGPLFVRVFDGDGTGGARIDIGAYERQTVPDLSLVVDTLIDENDGNYSSGDLSLREAIDLANGSAGPDTITFATSLTSAGPAAILLTRGELRITDAATIEGPGANRLTINASGNDPTPLTNNGDGSRVFNIDDGNVATRIDVEIIGLTLTGGDVNSSGGGIRSTENLTVANSIITGNVTVDGGAGGGIASGGSLTVRDSTISGNSTISLSFTGGSGGGISSSSENLVIERSTISGNFAAASGGGILLFGASGVVSNHTISGSTISGNTAYVSGGGIKLSGDLVSTTITNSTISGNVVVEELHDPTEPSYAVGGGISARTDVGFVGTLRISHSTIINNSASGHFNLFMQGDVRGGGISGRAELDHTIVAGNIVQGFQAPSGPDLSGEFDVRYSLIGEVSGATITNNGGILFGANPMLGPLADNGGSTLTHALLPTSPAIDRGDPSFAPPPGSDQRGAPFQRIADGNNDLVERIDIGAFEAQVVREIVVDSLNDEADGNHSDGNFSLREAVDLVNSGIFSEIDAIRFSPLLDGGTIELALSLGELVIAESVVIDATNLASGITIDGGDGLDDTFNTGDGIRLFRVDDGDSLTQIDVEIIGLTLTGGDVDGSGGAIWSAENLTLTGTQVSNNAATVGGGGIFTKVEAATTTIRDSTVADNTADFGGGLRTEADTGGVVLIERSTISGNLGTANGGGLFSTFSYAGAVTVQNSTISGNSTSGTGGGALLLTFTGGSVAIEHSTIAFNKADADSTTGELGGGISVLAGSSNISLSHTVVANNTTGGGARSDLLGNLTAEFSLIGDATAGNVADNGGNLIGTGGAPIDSLLAPLADNGGPTMTHALLAGSPAIDAGDPAASPGGGAVPLFDQRGNDFGRVQNGRIDIGAFEVRDSLSADFDGDGFITGFDFLLWQIGVGTPAPNALKSDGDADNDLDADHSDLGVWELQYGTAAPLVAAVYSAIGAEAASATNSEPAAVVEPVAPLSISEPLLVSAQVAATSTVPVATSTLSSDFIAAASTWDRLNKQLPRAIELAVEESVFEELFPDAPGLGDWNPPAAAKGGEESSPFESEQIGENADLPWLAEELLKRVFG